MRQTNCVKNLIALPLTRSLQTYSAFGEKTLKSLPLPIKVSGAGISWRLDMRAEAEKLAF